MSYTVESFVEPVRCESLIREMNAFIDAAYTPENVIARRTYVYEYAVAAEAFAFALHHPGSPETRHLPGFELSDLPNGLAEVCRGACDRMGVSTGRVLFNVTRYPENCDALKPHHDGELFEFDVDADPDVGNTVYRAIRPRKVGLLTLRNDSAHCGTWLHDADGKVTETNALAGELLIFDNTLYQHSVPNPGFPVASAPSSDRPRWIRYAIGWRAFEEDCFYWHDGHPLRKIDVREAIELQEQFLENDWPKQIDAALARGSFPFPTDRV